MSSSSSESISHDSRETAALLYPDIRRPLIYYNCAQVQFKDTRKRNDFNCFTNAVQWYNQEHTPGKKKTKKARKRDVKRFAAWLDAKYVEYLQENEPESNTKRTSNESEYEESQEGSDAHPRKKKKRLRSPWRKHKILPSIEDTNIITIPKLSVKTILEPKNFAPTLSEYGGSSNPSVKTIFKPNNMSRTVSELCRSARTEACCTNSMCHFEPNYMKQSIYQRCRSKSTYSFLNRTQLEVDIHNSNEDTQNKEYVWVPLETIKMYETEARLWNTLVHKDFHVPEETDGKMKQKCNKNIDSAGNEYQNVHFKDVVCQYFAQNEGKETSSQYIHGSNKVKSPAKRSKLHICCCPEDESEFHAPVETAKNIKQKCNKKTDSAGKEYQNVHFQKVVCECFPQNDKKDCCRNCSNCRPSKKSRTNICCCPEDKSAVLHKDPLNEKKSYSPEISKQMLNTSPEITKNEAINDVPVLLSHSVQTSDYPLILEYPFYMKVYFPDKPNDFENAR